MLVSDIGMPGEDGYAFIEKVRALPPDFGGQTPAIALTAYARDEDRVRALTAGYDQHIAKPITTVEFLALVGALAIETRAAGACARLVHPVCPDEVQGMSVTGAGGP